MSDVKHTAAEISAEHKAAADAADAANAARKTAATVPNPVPHAAVATPAPQQGIQHAASIAPEAHATFPKVLSNPKGASAGADRTVNNAAEEETARAAGFTNVVSGTDDDLPFIVTIGRCATCKQGILEGGLGAQGYTLHPDGGKDRTPIYVHNDCEAAKSENFVVRVRTEGVNKRIESLDAPELKAALLNEPVLEKSMEQTTRPTHQPLVGSVRPGAQKIG